jgi:hypothetical protein
MRSRIREPDGESRRCGRVQQRSGGRAGWLWCAWCCLALWWKSKANINQWLILVNDKFPVDVFFADYETPDDGGILAHCLK